MSTLLLIILVGIYITLGFAYFDFEYVVSAIWGIILYLFGISYMIFYKCKPHIKIKCDDISVYLPRCESELERLFEEPV